MELAVALYVESAWGIAPRRSSCSVAKVSILSKQKHGVWRIKIV